MNKTDLMIILKEYDDTLETAKEFVKETYHFDEHPTWIIESIGFSRSKETIIASIWDQYKPGLREFVDVVSPSFDKFIRWYNKNKV